MGVLTDGYILFSLFFVQEFLFFISNLSLCILMPSRQNMWVGMEAVEMTPSIKKQFNIQSSSGVLVARTFVDSPASRPVF